MLLLHIQAGVCDPYLLPSNMDQCWVLTSAVTALPAVSLMETAEAAWP